MGTTVNAPSLKLTAKAPENQLVGRWISFQDCLFFSCYISFSNGMPKKKNLQLLLLDLTDVCTLHYLLVVTIASRGWGNPQNHSQVHEYVLSRPNLQKNVQLVSKDLASIPWFCQQYPFKILRKFISFGRFFFLWIRFLSFLMMFLFNITSPKSLIFEPKKSMANSAFFSRCLAVGQVSRQQFSAAVLEVWRPTFLQGIESRRILKSLGLYRSNELRSWNGWLIDWLGWLGWGGGGWVVHSIMDLCCI